jgi:hypothetical protein
MGCQDMDDTGLTFYAPTVSTQFATLLGCYAETVHPSVGASTSGVVCGGDYSAPWIGGIQQILGTWATANLSTWDRRGPKEARSYFATHGYDQTFCSGNLDNDTNSYFNTPCQYEAAGLGQLDWLSQRTALRTLAFHSPASRRPRKGAGIGSRSACSREAEQASSPINTSRALILNLFVPRAYVSSAATKWAIDSNFRTMEPRRVERVHRQNSRPSGTALGHETERICPGFGPADHGD